jgi:chaperonin GroEL
MTGVDASGSHPELVDMVVSGILDPTKVCRNTITNAVSAVGTMLTTECMIALKSDSSAGGQHMPMM